MNYVIKNNKGVFIKLDDHGKQVTCIEKAKMVFEYSKAKNILENLPKTLKNLNFKVEAVPDIPDNRERQAPTLQKKYTPSESVTRWIKKFELCGDVICEAKTRKEELTVSLSNVDKELSNILHKIELEKSKNACEGFKNYKSIKTILDKRRIIKDELMILSSVLRMDFRNFSGEMVSKSVYGLTDRKFKIRVTSEGDDVGNVLQ